MSIHTSCLAEACKNLGIPYSFVGGDENFLQVNLEQRYYFPGASTPFNDGATSKICRDKEFSYKLLKDAITMPKSMGFVDPEGPTKYRGYVRIDSKIGIVDKICEEFTLPVIVKRNSGSQGQHVFLCKTRNEVSQAVTKVFERNPKNYDHVVLAQEYREAKKEYRVVIFQKQIILAYEKDVSNAVFTGNLSPLHWENSKAVNITDEKFLERLRLFIEPMYALVDLNYGGLDIIEDSSGEFCLLELNSKPGFGHFAKDNSREPLIQMYSKILSALK